MKKLFKTSLFIFFSILSVVMAYQVAKNLNLHFQERAKMDAYLQNAGVNKDVELNRELAILLSNKIRQDFNTNEDTWVNLNLKKEPFLRYTTLELLEWKANVVKAVVY